MPPIEAPAEKKNVTTEINFRVLTEDELRRKEAAWREHFPSLCQNGLPARLEEIEPWSLGRRRFLYSVNAEKRGGTGLDNIEYTTIDSSAGKIHFGLCNLEIDDPDVIVLPAADEDLIRRPLGVGAFSDAAKMAFKRAFIPSYKEKGKPTIVGDEESIAAFKRIMTVEMLTPRDRALDTGGLPIEDLGFFFDFETLRYGVARIHRAGGDVEVRRYNDSQEVTGFSTPYIVTDYGRGGERRRAGVMFTCRLTESVGKVDRMRESMEGRFYEGMAGRPSVHVIGAANLLSDEPDTCKVYDDGRGNKILLDMGIDLETLILQGEDPLRINTVLVTHPHVDHTRGVAEFLLYRAAKALEARKTGGSAERLKTTALVLNEETKNALETQMRSILDEGHFSMITDAVHVRVLKKENAGDLGYIPVDVNGTTLEAMDVRHVTERCIGYKLTSGCSVGGVTGNVSYAHSGDTQFGTAYLDDPKFRERFSDMSDEQFREKKRALEERDRALVRFLTPADDVDKCVVSIDSGKAVIHASPDDALAIDATIKEALGADRVGVLMTYQDHCPSTTENKVNDVFKSGMIIDLTPGGGVTQYV